MTRTATRIDETGKTVPAYEGAKPRARQSDFDAAREVLRNRPEGEPPLWLGLLVPIAFVVIVAAVGLLFGLT